jgi:hypothetical protein
MAAILTYLGVQIEREISQVGTGIGNSQPPLFTRSIVCHIRKEILPQAMMPGRVA